MTEAENTATAVDAAAETGAPVTPPTAVAETKPAAAMTIAEYAQLYSVSRNPFGIAAVLPLIIFAFIGLEVGVLYNVATDQLLGAFMIVSTGLLLIPAVVLRGDVTFDDEGIQLRYGKRSITAPWNCVQGLSFRRDCGVCVVLKGQTQTAERIRIPGGLEATRGGEAFIPLRFFGDRRFAILYEIRDRVPAGAWQNALANERPPSSRRPLLVYGLTVLFGAAAMIAVAIAETH